MTRDKAQRIINKINNLERYFSNLEQKNKEVAEGLMRIRRNLHSYF